jgi:putative lipoprotein
MLEGGWDRAIRSAVAGREGFVLAPEGRLSLLGIFSMQGVSWRLDGNALVLTTSTERYPEPIESRLAVEELTPQRLVLSGTGYLAGTYERRAYGTIEGTVTYRQRIALTPEAIVQVELRDVTRVDAEAPLLAKRVIHTDGRQVPIPFALDYDVAAVQKGHSYAVSARIADRGQLQDVTDTPVPVFTGEPPAPVEILVVPVH